MIEIKKKALFFSFLLFFLCHQNMAISEEVTQNIFHLPAFENPADKFPAIDNTDWNISERMPLYASNNYIASDRSSANYNSTATALPPFLLILLLDDPDCNDFSPTIFYTDDFGNGNADEWEIIDDAGKQSNWEVSGEKYIQSVNRVDRFDLSYHLGSFAYYDDPGAFNRSNYHVSARIRSLSSISGLRDSIGLMVRYQNRNNYLRVLISKMQGFVRLEKKVDGEFSSLAFNGRPPELGSVIDLAIDLINDTVFVYVNNEPVFSFSDPDLGSGKPLGWGTIALFTQSKAEFSDIVIRESNPAPRLLISEPMAYSVASTDENSLPHKLNVTANAENVPSGGGVQFTLNSQTPCNVFTAPYSTTGCPSGSGFGNVQTGDHQVIARIINSSGTPIRDCHHKDRDTNTNIGIGGKYIVMLGDSITNGVGDNSNSRALGTQNNSANGKNLNRGIAPVLNDLISDRVALPVVVYNEGLGGTTSQDGLNRLESTINRHEKDQLTGKIWLILFGTNDSSSSIFLPDGSDCTEADFLNNDSSCIATYKYYLRKIILNLKATGDIPILGKVPYVRNSNETRLTRIQKYNLAIEQLTTEHYLLANPPDFYTHFENNQATEFFDNLHPNGIGYGSMAQMWFCALIPNIIPGLIPDYCSNY